MTIYPVVMPVSRHVQQLSGREKVAALSQCARQALRLSARRLGIAMPELRKNNDDAPLAFDGYYWSVSHKPRYVAAVIGRDRIGIDIEEMEPRRQDIFRYVASEEEWQILGGKSRDSLYRCWTAKEAVVKSAGVGLAGLKSCRVLDVRNNVLSLSHDGQTYDIVQLCHDGHIVSVVSNGNVVEWVILQEAAGSQSGQQFTRDA
ncbi:MAG: 4'-phosphopantetheinyl transferase superfamily protein [Dehalococcoidia bacterium]|nr:4'-phosphopantetheinyl transferase superfamily protein [Dehalococcoidia bacterium]